LKNKLRLIDAICEHHPSCGIEKGWSEYTGGMKDSGQWFVRKMLDCSEIELESFLNEIGIRQTDQFRESIKESGFMQTGQGWIRESEIESYAKIFYELDRKIFNL
jgi:hypothetical protein